MREVATEIEETKLRSRGIVPHTDSEQQELIFYQPQNISNLILFDLNAIEIATTIQKPSESEITVGYQVALRDLKKQILRAKNMLRC